MCVSNIPSFLFYPSFLPSSPSPVAQAPGSCKSFARSASAMSAALTRKKQTEGEECMRAAAKALKTSAMSFKFRPDWETACAEYEKAVTCFKASAAPYCRHGLGPIAASD